MYQPNPTDTSVHPKVAGHNVHFYKCVCAQNNKTIPASVPVVLYKSNAYVIITCSCARYKEIPTLLLFCCFCPPVVLQEVAFFYRKAEIEGHSHLQQGSAIASWYYTTNHIPVIQCLSAVLMMI